MPNIQVAVPTEPLDDEPEIQRYTDGPRKNSIHTSAPIVSTKTAHNGRPFLNFAKNTTRAMNHAAPTTVWAFMCK